MPTNLFQIRPLAYGEIITILSIDGGGIRGISPSIMLNFLEAQLQKLDSEEARIADYFDVVAGTSTGGLVTAMLTAPNENNCPLFAAKDIEAFYLDHCPKIFPQNRSIFANVTKNSQEQNMMASICTKLSRKSWETYGCTKH
ncbi:hypothetical protein Vadar_017358 [Vaccinium darrowii]|uniref:Uncharacterized protein n=1 Tax=Vaccinium darrowii TaxID=229202 RepID=A0ACB7XI54_9ERIC|nr:hypothetical protein Vadar_017358 [Vaccinium darrowii]